ncbi:hypothetical protein ACQPZX_41385 [Actinoplanes sp. CA-142083]|uniref:hypothetical protein n=1 Tax=Actinoplanes sp. CA-142083 TaxID=3239903 RepID=UPI003D8C7E41
MADWVLIPCLKVLFAEFDRIAPSRDRASDGSIGNRAHEQEVSDHNPDETGSVPIRDADHINEVHAIDVDNNLRESDLTMEKVVQFLLGRCRSGAEKRLRYIIYNRRIWSASSGWVQKTYTGASPHTEHAHFSASYTASLEASTASWHLEDIPVALTAADLAKIQAMIKANNDEAAKAVWAQPLGSPPGSDSPTWPAENMARNTYNEAKRGRIAAENAAAPAPAKA